MKGLLRLLFENYKLLGLFLLVFCLLLPWLRSVRPKRQGLDTDLGGEWGRTDHTSSTGTYTSVVIPPFVPDCKEASILIL